MPKGPRPAIDTVDPTHLLIERGTLRDKGGKAIPGAKGVQIRLRCGLVGAPYNGSTGYRATVWAGLVTCAECRQHPGVSGPGLAWNDLDTVPTS